MKGRETRHPLPPFHPKVLLAISFSLRSGVEKKGGVFDGRRGGRGECKQSGNLRTKGGGCTCGDEVYAHMRYWWMRYRVPRQINEK